MNHKSNPFVASFGDSFNPVTRSRRIRIARASFPAVFDLIATGQMSKRSGARALRISLTTLGLWIPRQQAVMAARSAMLSAVHAAATAQREAQTSLALKIAQGSA
ncbi:MAG: hypothetical protein AB7U38_14200 [Hyphomicrobiales bacterium]